MEHRRVLRGRLEPESRQPRGRGFETRWFRNRSNHSRAVFAEWRMPMSGHYICDHCGYDGGEHPDWCRNWRPPGRQALLPSFNKTLDNYLEGKMSMKQYRKKPVLVETVQWFPNVKHHGVKE